MKKYLVEISNTEYGTLFSLFCNDDLVASGLTYVEICNRLAKILSEFEEIGIISHFDTLDMYDDPVAFNEFMETL